MPTSLPAVNAASEDGSNRMNTGSDKDAYRMNRSKRGVFVIINNRQFEKSTGMNDGYGSDVDAANLYEVFTTLGFDVRLEHNKTTVDMLKVMNTVAMEDHSDHDCFMCAILSHGDEGVVYGTDGMIKIETLVNQFKGNTCPTLVGKPKVFIIQAERGNQLDNGIEVADGIGPEQRTFRIPEIADFLYAYATPRGYYSWRNSIKGSWFIQALCKVFTADGKKHDILTLLTEVNRLVAYDFQSNASREDMNRKKQIPSIVSMLTKELYMQPGMNTESDDDVYRMNSSNRGVFVIINNRHFQMSTGMSDRSGSDVDAANLYEVFTTFGFDVRLEHNKTTVDMLRIMKTVADEDHTDNGCFMCAILSHGDEGIVYGTDGIIQIDVLTSPFKGGNCPTLVGKPKVFIVQTVRGNKLDHGIEVADGIGVGDGEASIIRLPEEADFLYAHSTAPGYLSWRNTNKGSWFIQALCKVFETDTEKHDILTLLTKVNRLVAYDFQSNASHEDMNRKKQIPSIVSMLTKQLYLSKK